MRHHIPAKKKPPKNTFQIKLGISIAIIASALVLKTFAGGPESEASRTIDRVVNGGLNYKEAISAIGRAASGEEDVIAVFRNFAMPAQSEEKKEPVTDTETEVSEPVIDIDFYKNTPDSERTDAQETAKTAETKQEENAQPTVSVPESSSQPTVKVSEEQKELAEAEKLSFEMSPEELADDTKAVPFTIPPPSYCSYEQVDITFQHTTPVYGTITSKFGYRDHPIGGKASFHTGLDIAAKSGTAVSCFADGTVLEAAYNDTYGNYVLVEHSGGIRSFYGHNSKLTVKKGQKVKMGQKVSEVGTTGLSTGPHLHFEVRKGTLRLDPKYYISTERV